MALHRFLVPVLSPSALINLPDDEAHHAGRVLRCCVGDRIVVFDGEGNESESVIVEIDKRQVLVKTGNTIFAPRDHQGRLHFAVSLPKGDRQKNVIEKLVELGVDVLTPLETERSVAHVSEGKLSRLDRYVIEACKQCHRNRLLKLSQKLSLQEIFTQSTGFDLWILHPSEPGIESESISQANATYRTGTNKSLMFMVGPEGGFTNHEVELAIASGARALCLGERILRVETAVATAAVLGSCWLSGSLNA
jgi:16S rRNA (uracil1498-N3)-methyltransferase